MKSYSRATRNNPRRYYYALNLVGQVHLPDLLSSIVPGVPAGPLQRTVQRIVQEIPVAGTVSRVAHAAIPAVPASAHIPIRIEQVPVMIDHAPLVRGINSNPLKEG